MIVYENVIYIDLSVSFYENIMFWNSRTSYLPYVLYKVGSFMHNAIVLGHPGCAERGVVRITRESPRGKLDGVSNIQKNHSKLKCNFLEPKYCALQ